jgi:CBS domain containing-hemolysin-like protein
VADEGIPPNTQTCDLTIILFDFEDTVTTQIIVNSGNLNRNTLADVLSSILGVDVDVVRSNQVNGTFFAVDFIGRDGLNLLSSEELERRILTLLADMNQVAALLTAGYTIVDVMSNAPMTTTTPEAVPTRPIPAWAVAVIVVLNSVIIITVLLVILCITLRRYKR